MADWIFDGVNKIIKEPNVGSGNLNWDVSRDIYSAWKRWVLINPEFEAAFIVEGGTPIGTTGLFTGSSFILTNGWKLMAGDWNHISFVNGNLFSDDGIDTIPNPSFSASLKTFGSVNAQGVATGGVQQLVLDTVELLVKETHQLLGFNKDIPMTSTPTSITSGDIVIDITGDCENITTLSRQNV